MEVLRGENGSSWGPGWVRKLEEGMNVGLVRAKGRVKAR